MTHNTTDVMSEPIRLNIGAGRPEDGEPVIPGFTPIDARLGHDALALPYGDNTVEEVYASHVLEHIPHRDRMKALREWHRVLKPGGRIRVAVPDFAYIVEAYQQGRYDIPIEGYVCGAQTYPENFHLSIYDYDSLSYWLDQAGFVGIDRFAPEYADCSRLQCSLNLEAYKPPELMVNGKLPRKIIGCMSAPRLLFLDMVQSCENVIKPMGIPVSIHTGSNWGQCLERCFERACDEGYEWILALDYDTVFSRSQFVRLLTLFEAYGDKFDALAPLQIKREGTDALFFRKDQSAPIDLYRPIFPADSAHFGCTLIKTEVLKRMKHPWFQHVPNAEGKWDDGRIDDDIRFWYQFKEAGGRLGVTSRVSVGHLQLMVSWIGEGWRPVHQFVSDYRKNGPPVGTGHIPCDSQVQAVSSGARALTGAKGAG
jgi:predicted SAM-dependent methyltransferase